MPIVAIFDIVGSTSIETKKREKVLDEIRALLEELNKSELKDNLLAKPAITGGDSIEILAKNGKAVMYFIHMLNIREINVRTGLGAGKVDIFKEYADECDGPAFWAARKALEECRRRKVQVWLETHKTAKNEEKLTLKLISLFTIILQYMSREQRKYCYNYIWKNMSITEIAKKENVSPSNISQIIKKTVCKAIKQTLMK